MENNYFQIVRPQSLTLEELKQFYPNIRCVDENQIQYVINPEDQQFAQQQVLIAQESSLSNSEGSHVVVEPAHIVGYQNTDSVEHRRQLQTYTRNEEQNVENFHNIHQIYYTTPDAAPERILHTSQATVIHHPNSRATTHRVMQPQCVQTAQHSSSQIPHNIILPHQAVVMQQNAIVQNQNVIQRHNHLIQQRAQLINIQQQSKQDSCGITYEQQKTAIVQQPVITDNVAQQKEIKIVDNSVRNAAHHQIRMVNNSSIIAAQQTPRVVSATLSEVLSNQHQQRILTNQVTPGQNRVIMQRHILIQQPVQQQQRLAQQHVVRQPIVLSPRIVTTNNMVTNNTGNVPCENNGNRLHASLTIHPKLATPQQLRSSIGTIRQPVANSSCSENQQEQVFVQIKQQPRKTPEAKFEDLDDLEDSIAAAVLQKAPRDNDTHEFGNQTNHQTTAVSQARRIMVNQEAQQSFPEQLNNFEQNTFAQQQCLEKDVGQDASNTDQRHCQNAEFNQHTRISRKPALRGHGGRTRGTQRNRQNANRKTVTNEQRHSMMPNHTNIREPGCEASLDRSNLSPNHDSSGTNCGNQQQQAAAIREAAMRDSARMLVILQSGEQRLITFTLPKETCAVQDLLEQVGIPFTPNTNIHCVSNPGADIDYIVTVGKIENCGPIEVTNSDSDCNAIASNQPQSHVQKCLPDSTGSPEKTPPKSPDQTATPSNKEIPPRYVNGMLALCKFCGYTGVDFNKCQRCKRKFTEEPKSIPHTPVIGNNNKKKDSKDLKSNKLSPPKDPLKCCSKDSINMKKARKPRKIPDPEPEVLTLSSDEEGSKEAKLQHCSADYDGAGQALSMEPVITADMENGVEASTRREPIEIGIAGVLYTALDCRTIRIGSFKYSPLERVVFTSRGIRIMAPTIDDSQKHEILHIQHREVIKILVHFGKTLPVIFIYLLPSSTKYVRERLNMVDRKEGLYFDSCAKEEMFKRITLLPESITEEHSNILKKLYGKPSVVLDELSARDANEILIKTCPREKTLESGIQSQTNEIRQILIYPPGKGGISINTEDYGSLAQDQFLNDVIIDFYLKYLCKELLSEELRNKTHVFSSFFYKRLTTKVDKMNRSDSFENKLTAAQKRHVRVKNWTKNVNLFEKDFIVIPINESSHWFLAIVCFPGMKGPHTFDGNKPIDCEDLNDRVKKDKGTPNELTIGATTITPISKSNSAASLNTITKNNIFGEEERDEADGSESDLEESASEPENEDAPTKNKAKVAIKQPCILIFDSLAGGISRQRVVATLRDYLTCEFQSRTGTAEAFDKLTMRGACPKVPQQNNFTDCGLYLLQYVEQFFKVPITNYSMPIKQLTNWFEEIVVTRKREEISELIKSLVANCNPDSLPLPDIPFPTVNGKLIDAEMPDVSEDYEDQFTEIDEVDEEEEAYEEEEEEGDGYMDGDTSFSQESENGQSHDETRHNTSNSVKRAMTDSESESDGISPVQRRMKISDYDTNKHNGFSEFI